MALAIDVISDVVCPWCYVGKRRLEKAIEAAPIRPTVRWRPYQLDAAIPPDGRDRRAYMTAKFGSAERVRETHEKLSAIGREEGIAFAFDRISISPNTLDAHRLIRWAGESDVQDKVVEALFRAYFVEGRNIGDGFVLAEIAGATGLYGQDVLSRLGSDLDRDAVRKEIEYSERIGVTGVPTFVFAERYALIGAQPAEQIFEAIKTAAAGPGPASWP